MSHARDALGSCPPVESGQRLRRAEVIAHAHRCSRNHLVHTIRKRLERIQHVLLRGLELIDRYVPVRHVPARRPRLGSEVVALEALPVLGQKLDHVVHGLSRESGEVEVEVVDARRGELREDALQIRAIADRQNGTAARRHEDAVLDTELREREPLAVRSGAGFDRRPQRLRGHGDADDDLVEILRGHHRVTDLARRHNRPS